jgi:hypothetical protein
MDPPVGLEIDVYAFDDELRQCPIPNDHPYDMSRSLSVTVFHPILAKFKYDLANLSTVEPTSRIVELTLEFVVKSLEIYSEEEDRIKETRPVLQRLLGYRSWILIRSCPTTGKVFHDRDLALVAAVEWRNEFASVASTDASVEVAEAYRKHVLQSSVCMRVALPTLSTLTRHSSNEFAMRAVVPLFYSPSWVHTCAYKAPSCSTKSSTELLPSTYG